jgi:hypothetical protein
MLGLSRQENEEFPARHDCTRHYAVAELDDDPQHWRN